MESTAGNQGSELHSLNSISMVSEGSMFTMHGVQYQCFLLLICPLKTQCVTVQYWHVGLVGVSNDASSLNGGQTP